jgi:hypothetical protein
MINKLMITLIYFIKKICKLEDLEGFSDVDVYPMGSILRDRFPNVSSETRYKGTN